MMGKVSIDISLENIWKCWFLFRKGKKPSFDIDSFAYFLEENLRNLQADLASGCYRHGGYRSFVVSDNKRREISVASVSDRVVHRLLYEYLVPIFDRTFIFDAWSCRKEKGLLGAIERTKSFFSRYPKAFVWRADVRKFFDNVDHDILKRILSFRVADPLACMLLKEVIGSYRTANRERERESTETRRKGIPIGNLTSQIFANIYLNELDRFVKHSMKPKAYLRYGDDFFIITDDRETAVAFRERITFFLSNELLLEINPKHDILISARKGLRFLGVEIFPGGRRMNKRNRKRVIRNLDRGNIASYRGLVAKHEKKKRIKHFDWMILDFYDEL